jgi:ABC-type sugar transport system substrate-binding protein
MAVRHVFPLALLAALCACSGNSSSTSSSSSSAAPASGKTIGVSIQNREAQFYQDMESGMKAEAAKYGYALLVVDASRDNT